MENRYCLFIVITYKVSILLFRSQITDNLLHQICIFQGIAFYTQTKTITSLWREEDASDKVAPTAMPTMK